MPQYNDKVVLVTGAGRGLGREIAKAFAAQGARVAANDLTPVNLDDTLAEIQSTGGQVRGHLYDIAKKMPAQALVQDVQDEWGRIDILINNAGVRPRAALLLMDEWDWQRTLEVNLSGPFYLTQAVGRLMREQGSGAIVNIASSEALEILSSPQKAGASLPTEVSAFLASKCGLIGLSQAAAAEFEAYNIRVNTVCPVRSDPETVAWAAALVLSLCSPQADAVTGQVFVGAGASPEKERNP